MESTRENTTLKVGDNDKFELNTLYMGPAVTKFNPMEKWLRTPMKMPRSVGTLYMMHRLVYYFVYGVNLAGYVAPVFHMNLSSVLFASSAQEATANAEMDLNAMSFRYQAQDQISSMATYNEKGITISNAGNDEYLYIQWKEGEEEKVYSCKATNGTVFAQTIGGKVIPAFFIF